MELDESGGISDDTRGPNRESYIPLISRKDFIFLLLAKFKLTDDIKEIIDKICPIAMDLEFLERKFENLKETEDIFRIDLWKLFEELKKTFLELLESKLY